MTRKESTAAAEPGDGSEAGDGVPGDEERDEIVGWFVGRIPDDWFTGRPDFRLDRDEVIVIGELAPPPVDDADSPAVVASAIQSRIDGFRKATRARRIEIAKEAERIFERKVSWGVVCEEERQLFATLAAPSMTRLRMGERRVLDTLIEAGVARSRSEALAWCVRLVGHNEAVWLEELTEALEEVKRARASGPHSVTG